MNESNISGKRTEGPELRSLTDAFAHVVQSCADNVAVMTADKSLTFSQLDELSEKLARTLQAKISAKRKLVGDDQYTVLLALPPSIDRIIALLALFKLNLAYVPVEACVPKNRIKLIIREVQPIYILTCESLTTKFTQSDIITEGISDIFLYDDLLQDSDQADYGSTVNLSHVACVLYTSGSTGEPKGVMLTHQNIMARLTWQWRQFPFTGTEVGIIKTSLLFVDSITECWRFLLKGRPVVVLDGQTSRNPALLVDAVRKHRVTRLLVVPSLLQSLLVYVRMTERQQDLTDLREIICSGETLPQETAKMFFDVFTQKTLINFYGSTEFTGDGTYDVYTSLDDVNSKNVGGAMSIGVPIDNVDVQLVDDDMAVVRAGEVGQILVRGPTVMLGYVGNEPQKQDDWYPTGDYGRLVNGRIFYEGRKDNQVKIRGNRVNTTEIEQTIGRVPSVESVVILVMEAESSAAQIVAFVAGEKAEEKAVLDACRQSLPDYMLPRVLLLDAQIPLSEATGKTDRVKLREMYRRRTTKTNAKTPDDPAARHLLRSAAKQLDIEESQLDLDQDFFALGGNSVNVVRLAAEMADGGFPVVFERFIAARTLREMLTSGEVHANGDARFKLVQVDENSPRHELVQMVTDVFAERSELVLASGCSRDDLYLFFDNYYDLAKKVGGNAMIIESLSGEIVGLNLLYDIADARLPENMSPQISLVVEMLSVIEASFKDVYKDGDRIMDYIVLGTSKKLSREEKAEAIYTAEVYSIQLAARNGFTVLQAVNVSHVTQAIASSLGYVTTGTMLAKDYTRPDGSRPLAHAAEDARLMAQIKRIR